MAQRNSAAAMWRRANGTARHGTARHGSGAPTQRCSRRRSWRGQTTTGGETPCAFVKLMDGASATEAEIISFCREMMPRYMAPKTVVFKDLPKTSTGKTQKFVLRDKARDMGSLTKTGNSKL
nr:unnamed protein product [Digitaria exilis]